MAIKESDTNRYLRSTISNIAFLAAVGYFVHEKAISETSVVTIMTLFMTGYFGVRAYQHRTEVDIAASQSSPRFPIPGYKFPPDDPPPPPPPNVHDAQTRPSMDRPLIPRTDETPTNPGGRGRFRKWAVSFLLRSGFAPAAMVIALCLIWIILNLTFGAVVNVVGLKTSFAM